MLSGFKTVIFNLVAIFAAWMSTQFGIDIDPELQMAIAVTIVGVGNLILRAITKNPIFNLGKDEPDETP